MPWRHHRRWMYERLVDEPRLSCWYGRGSELPDPALEMAGDRLERLYAVPLAGPGLNYYRDGRDSVAFHADRELKHLSDTIVAIVTLGATRPFLVRPRGGGRSLDFRPASGDLLVMGGACQAPFEHARAEDGGVGTEGERLLALGAPACLTGPIMARHPESGRRPAHGGSQPSDGVRQSLGGGRRPGRAPYAWRRSCKRWRARCSRWARGARACRPSPKRPGGQGPLFAACAALPALEAAGHSGAGPAARLRPGFCDGRGPRALWPAGPEAHRWSRWSAAVPSPCAPAGRTRISSPPPCSCRRASGP